MNYALEIKDHNVECHLDIENDIAQAKDGLFTFTIRMHNGKIVDYNVTEYVDARQYFVLKRVVIQELTISPYHGERDTQTPIRDNNLHNGASEPTGGTPVVEHSEE